MPLPFAINGLGRIGRALLRIATERSSLEPVAANDVAAAPQLAHLLAYDTLHRRYAGTVESDTDSLTLDGHEIRIFGEADPAKIPWEETGARVVIDATGKCLTRDCAESHRRGPVEKVVVSANAEGMDLTLCRAVNDRDYDPERHHLLSGASCTTNCLAPVAFLLHRDFGLRRAMLNTVHSYNNDQRLLESAHRDLRRARAAALNMIPTSTSAIEALGRVMPELAGRLEGFAVRVPTPNVSLIDVVAELDANPSAEEVNRTFIDAAAGGFAGVLATTEDELVSSDFMGDPHSAIVDLSLTRRLESGENALVRVVAWYDNEWGHAARLADILEMLAASDHLREA
ncbi:MAG: type I glyceraldehyde-3-phosphate dehydrogenase [Thermoanaerobaculia bacterium]